MKQETSSSEKRVRGGCLTSAQDLQDANGSLQANVQLFSFKEFTDTFLSRIWFRETLENQTGDHGIC